jgi:hypothetical protein
LSTSEPFHLIGKEGAILRGNILYVVGRLRGPQALSGNLVTIARGQVDILDSIELGMMQLLQLGGEGAPSMGVWEFFAEHFRRRDLSAGPMDSSNRRVSFDVAVQPGWLWGARLYYELAFEDTREEVLDAVRFDADHLVGLELAAIGPGRRHGVVVEAQRTGVRSHEHSVRTTGFTNAGRVGGSPLGPDARSLFGGGRIELGWGTVLPWAEVARLSSDTYLFVVRGGISRASDGVDELRYRAGSRIRVPIGPGLRVEGEGWTEHVRRAGFEPGQERQNLGAAAQIVWQPGGALGRVPVGGE